MEEGGEQWEVIKFPALATQDETHRKQGEPLWVDKYDLKALENIKKTIGVYDWSALYQQTPTNSETQEFKQEFWQYRTMEEVLALTTYRTLTIDTAISQKASADYTGLCANFTDRENKWNLKSWKEKISPLELIDLLFNLQEQYRFDSIGIEKTIYLQAIKPFLDEEMRRRNRFLPIVELQHNGVQKEIRIRALLPRYESKSIYHITGQCTDLEEDQLSFPKGIHDDVLDATAYQIQIARASMTEQRPTYNLNRHSLR
jgi:phage terminase large subunit-like protein